MSEDKSAEVLDFLRAWRETADSRLGRIEARLGKIEDELVDVLSNRKQLEAELAVLRGRQNEQDFFNRGIASFMVEVQASLTRIERKLED